MKGRDNYNKIIIIISKNSFDNNSKIIYDNFIGKYLPTNNNYSSLIEMIDNTVVDAHNKNYTEFLNTKKLNDVVNNYKKNFNNLPNLVFGKESIEKFIIILQKILEIKIKKFYSNINSLNDRFYIQFYQKNFKDSFFLSSKTREILYKFEEIEKKIKNIENDFKLIL